LRHISSGGGLRVGRILQRKKGVNIVVEGRDRGALGFGADGREGRRKRAGLERWNTCCICVFCDVLAVHRALSKDYHERMLIWNLFTDTWRKLSI
jgi:hypothetical protein